MAGIFNLVYVMVLFLSLFIAIINVDGKHLFKLLIHLIHNISFSFILILLYTCFKSQHLVNVILTMVVQIICVRILKLESVFIIIVIAFNS